MTWTAPTPPAFVDGPMVGDDRPILEGLLAWQRHTLLSICAGLTGAQLAVRASEPSHLSLLGLVRHMTKVERIWFRQRVAREPVGPLYEAGRNKDPDFEDLDPARAEQDFERFDHECRLADRAVAAIAFQQTCTVGDEVLSLRFVYLHMIAEYSRHNGHGDLLRERIDGVTGR